MSQTPRPSALQWLEDMNSNKISSVELVQETLDRIHAVNPRLNAVVAEDAERSLKEAMAADQKRHRKEQLPLLGLPITLKDSIDVTGFACTGGSYARQNFHPQRDATVAARLRAAGAILIAKTNLPEYSSSSETNNSLFGRTNNPIDPERTPGGSTGGEAALLGADASIAGIGIDGGMSIRVPSHYCGIVGIRPTTGRVPDTGTWPATRDCGYRDLMCVGPMARYTSDLSLLLSVISGPDWQDPYAVPAPLLNPATVNPAELRVGFYHDDGVARVSEETIAAIESAAQVLEGAGARISKAKLPDVSEATELFFSLAGADGGTRTRQDLSGSGGRHHAQFQQLLDGFGAPMLLSDFYDLQGRFFEFRASIRSYLSENFDVLIAPVSTGPAPLHGKPPHGVPEDEYKLYRGFNNLHTFALAGVPVAVVPAGTQDGMPLGVQIVAPAFQEHVALAAAGILEQALGGFQPPETV